MRVSVVDRMEIADRRTTSDGYLAVRANIARTGVYQYTRREIGLTDGNPNELVGVYRPDETVFSDESLGSFAHRPITIGHPAQDVNASNWRKLAVGQIGNTVRRDGDHVVVDLLLMDEAGIRAATDSHKQLSAGYACELDLEDGVSPAGEPYKAVMRGPLKANHVALVPAGRAGSTCRIGDAAWPTENTPPQKEHRNMATFMLDGLKVDLSDTEATTAALKKLQDAASAATAETATVRASLADEQAARATDATNAATTVQAKDAEIATLTATNATLNAELADARDPAKLRDAAAEYGRTVDKAKALGATVADSDSIATVRRNAVSHRLGDVAKDWTDAQVDVSFATLTASVADAKPDAFRTAMADRQPIDFADAAAKSAAARAEMIAGFTSRDKNAA